MQQFCGTILPDAADEEVDQRERARCNPGDNSRCVTRE
jgi:hypothetical protein